MLSTCFAVVLGSAWVFHQIWSLVTLYALQTEVEVATSMLVEESENTEVGEVYVLHMIRSWYKTTDDGRIWFRHFYLSSVLHRWYRDRRKTVCHGSWTPATWNGKILAHTGDTRLVNAVMGLIEISGMEFIRYDQFGRVLTILDHQDGGDRFQIKLVEVLLDDCSTVVTGVNCDGFRCLVWIKRLVCLLIAASRLTV